MNITKEQADKVIAALSMNRIMARDENGNYTKEITAQVVVEALSIMRGLADAEPVHYYDFELPDGDLRTVTCWWVDRQISAGRITHKLRISVDTSPQAAQTEAQEREAFEAWYGTTYWDAPEWEPERNCYKEFPIHMAWQSWRERAGRKG